jgi:hypothetical protein
MTNKLFVIIMWSDYERTRIGYCGLFPNKQEILKRIPILNYNDLIYKEKKYKTCKSLFDCIEIPSNKKHYFSSYHLCDYKRFIQRQKHQHLV